MRRVLRDRNFQIYALGSLISYLGTWAQRIAIGWLSWSLTHEVLWVGLISLAQILPLIAFGPLFGALLDRNDHRRYAVAVNTALAVIAAVLYGLTASGLMHIHILLLLAFLLGVANSAYQASRLAMVNDVVPPSLLTDAIAANSLIFNLTRAVGPAIAGVIIARYGMATAFAVNAISFIAILCALTAVRLRPQPARRPAQGLLAESREGLRYVIQNIGIRRLMLLSAITSILARGVLELLPAFAASVFHTGSLGLANLTTCTGVGAVAGALVLSRAGANASLARLTRIAAYGVGPSVALFGLAGDIIGGLLLTAALGFGIVLCSVGLQVLLQSSIPDHLRGRVLGLWTAVNVAGPGVGGALIGALTHWVDLQAITVAGGLLCGLLVGWVMPPTLSKLPHPD